MVRFSRLGQAQNPRFDLQTLGFATGLICAVQLAHCYLRGFDLMIKRSLSGQLYLLKRYVDDLLLAVSVECLLADLLQMLNSFHRSVKVTHDPVTAPCIVCLF